MLPDGEYDATIVSAEEKMSKQNNSMIEVVLRCYASGQEVDVTDWLMMPWKIESISRSVGHNFESGSIEPHDLVDKNVRVRLVTQEDAKYGKQNRVANYLGAAKASSGGSVSIGNDPDIPF